MAINAQHPEYSGKLKLWQEISDIVNGENLKGYLVELNPQDKSEDNKKRNKQYQERAIFYAVAGWTVRGMLGAMFTKWPTFNVPPSMEYLKTNADGAGQSIYQQSQAVSVDVISNGRAGLCVSFPEKEEGGALSQADINSKKYVATIHKYEPKQIINWSTKQVGAQIILSLVCTTEVETVIDDYEHVQTNIIRERKINDAGQYEEIVWKEVKGDNGVIKWEPGPIKIPTQSDGKPWNIIPFQFVGSESNTPDVNTAPMKELVHVNIGHYRNSADFEDNVWYCGQSQPWMSGIDQALIDLMEKNNMYVGSRNLIGTKSGERFEYATAPANPLVAQAMKDKIELMIGLGARFLAPGSAVKTATQAEGELSMQHSVLSLIASNVSEAYTQCLQWCALFMGEKAADLAYTISQDFVKTIVDANMLREMVASWLQGAMPAADLFNWMRKNELIDPEKTDEDINEELASNSDRITAEL